MFRIRNVITLKYLLVFIVCARAQEAPTTSPCPRLFVYEGKSNEPGKWFGLITLLSDTDLNGIWLRVILDRPCVQLGNWFGQVTTTDNIEFLIKNRNFALKAHTPHIVRLFIKYNEGEPVPQLASFRLNAKTLCPEEASKPESTPELQTSGSNIEQATPSPVKPPERGDGSDSISGIPGGFHPEGGTENGGDDFFEGDFNKVFNEGSANPSPGENVDLNPDCGTVIVRSKSDTQSVVEGEFPWHAALYYVKGINLVYICSGNLISKSHVLSAAHCLTINKSKSTLNPDKLLVYLDKYYLRRFSNTGIQDRSVITITIHKDYNPQSFDNDIGIVTLSPSVDVTDHVRPICLWQDRGDWSYISNKLGTVVGWGYDKSGKITDQLIQGKMALASLQTCTSSIQGLNSQFTSRAIFCAGFSNTTSTCVGNSGSGMAFRKSNSRNQWQLRGLVVFNTALQTQQNCDASQYVVFIDIVKHLEWIKQTVMKVI